MGLKAGGSNINSFFIEIDAGFDSTCEKWYARRVTEI